MKIKDTLLEIQELEETNEQLKARNEFLEKQNQALRLRCSDYSIRLTNLEDEVAGMRLLGVGQE